MKPLSTTITSYTSRESKLLGRGGGEEALLHVSGRETGLLSGSVLLLFRPTSLRGVITDPQMKVTGPVMLPMNNGFCPTITIFAIKLTKNAVEDDSV